MQNPRIVYLPKGVVKLPDKPIWKNRLRVPGSDGKSTYIVAQRHPHGWWGCGCKGWVHHQNCHHLSDLGLPGYKDPTGPVRFEASKVYTAAA